MEIGIGLHGEHVVIEDCTGPGSLLRRVPPEVPVRTLNHARYDEYIAYAFPNRNWIPCLGATGNDVSVRNTKR
jgi:hypothetical protein